jgi:hypothetical protein
MQMDPITPLTAGQRGAWKMDPLTQTLLRPMRIRPTHPIHLNTDSDTRESTRKKIRPGKRARIKKIDPSLWGNMHLREEDFEHSVIKSVSELKATSKADTKLKREERGGSEPRGLVVEEAPHSMPNGRSSLVLVHLPVPLGPIGPSHSNNPTEKARSTAKGVQNAESSVVEEKNCVLNLLRSMFGDSEEWGGQETFESDDEAALPTDLAVSNPVEFDQSDPGSSNSKGGISDTAGMREEEGAVEKQQQLTSSKESRPERTSLKDMFKPQDTEGGAL